MYLIHAPREREKSPRRLVNVLNSPLVRAEVRKEKHQPIEEVKETMRPVLREKPQEHRDQHAEQQVKGPSTRPDRVAQSHLKSGQAEIQRPLQLSSDLAPTDNGCAEWMHSRTFPGGCSLLRILNKFRTFRNKFEHFVVKVTGKLLSLHQIAFRKNNLHCICV